MSREVLLVAVLGGLGTFASRAALLLAADRFAELDLARARALRMIPPAVLGALVAPGVLRAGGELDLVSWHVVAAALAALVAWRTRNVAATMAVGLSALMALQQLG